MIDAEGPGLAARVRTAWDLRVLARLPPLWVALGTAGCEAALAVALMRGLVGPVPVLAAHIALCLLIALRAAQGAEVADRPDARAALIHLALWTFVAGPLGSLLALGLAVLDEMAARPALERDFGTWIEAEGALGPPTPCSRLRSDLQDGRLRIGNANAIPALSDVFVSGSKEAKFEALAIVGRRFDPSLTHVIRAAIQDGDASVRVLASTVLAKLQTRFTRELIALEEAAARAPDDAPAWIALARARRAYAESGLTEALQARTEMQAARLAARRAVTADPRDAAARALLAEIEAADGPCEAQTVPDAASDTCPDAASDNCPDTRP